MSETAPKTGPEGRLGADLPDGWSVVASRTLLGSPTQALIRAPDGTTHLWSSRRDRKGLGTRRSDIATEARHRPGAVSLVIGGLFAVGSLCFAVGSLPLYFDNVEASTVAATFFVGSLFFTSAAYLQYREVIAAPEGIFTGEPEHHRLGALIGWRPRRIAWWATLIQLAGTVFFNVSTFAATRSDLTFEQEKHLVWAPDFWGSGCFLLASWLAFVEVSPRQRRLRGSNIDWQIAGLNLAGSVAFGAAAIGARYLETTGEPANIALVNLGTFIGASCFLLGAALLPVESAERVTPQPARTR